MQYYRFRGLSVVIASIIMFAFLILTIVPLILNFLTSGTQESMVASLQASLKVRESIPALNITLDTSASSTTIKVYTVENTAVEEKKSTLFVVEDDTGLLYLLRPGACVDTWCTAGTARVSVTLVQGATRVDRDILLEPSGVYRVTVVNGRLRAVYVGATSYSPVYAPLIGVVEEALYAEVAGSVQTQFLNMSLFTDVNDLVTGSSGVLLSTSPSPTPNPSILYTGVMMAACGSISNNGSFQPRGSVDGYVYDGIVLYNLNPQYGSIVLGGLGGNYTGVYNTSMLASFKNIALYDASRPGIIVARKGGDWFLLVVKDGKELLVNSSNPLPSGSGLNTLLSFLEGRLSVSSASQTVYTSITSSPSTPVQFSDTATVLLDSGGYGLVMITSNHVVYCAPSMFTPMPMGQSLLLLELRNCPAVNINTLSPGVVNAVVSVSPYGSATTSTGTRYYGYSENATITSGAYVTAGTPLPRPPPVGGGMARLKLAGETTVVRASSRIVSSSNETTYGPYDGPKAFGFYYYSNPSLGSGLSVYHGILAYGLGPVRVKMFEFKPGTVGGVDPYFVFADTDGNGLVEMIFMTEDAGYGDRTSNNDLANGGCLDWNEKPLYLIFTSGDYFVYGKEYAEVSIQVRYMFHDNSNDDPSGNKPETDDVTDPKQYIFSFQLIDLNGTVYMTADYVWQTLTALENTWPPSSSWTSDTVFLLVPDKDQYYTIAFSFNDPYSYGSGKDAGRNDVDFTVSIEWLGYWKLKR